MAETKRSTGNVKWFSAQKGFGFIAPDDGSEDLFVHQTSIQSDGFRTLSDGQPVEFSVDSGEEGRTKAVDVVGVSRSRRPPRGGRGGGRGYYVGRGRGGGGFGRGGRSNGGGYEGGGYGGGGGGGGGGRACFNCGRYGHLARDCYQGSGRGGIYGGGGSRGYSGGGGGGGRGGGCYNCGEEGHFARDCPNTDNK